jgi:DNA modification methylase
MKQLIKINQVKSNPNNPRLIKNDKFKKLVKSVQDFPEMLELRPIVVDENMIVLGGNMRLKACIEAGLKEVWIEVADLTEQQKKEFTIKDNVGFGEWEWDMLANEWEQTELEDWGLDGFPFEDEVLEAEEDDFAVPDEIKTDIVLGDLFEIGEHRLLCGDSTDSDQVAKLMNGSKADMVFTDPPYGDNHAKSEMIPVNERQQGKSIVSKVHTISNDENIDFLREVANTAHTFLNEGFCAFVFFKWNKWEKIKEYFSIFGEPKTVCVWDRDSQGASTFRINPVHEFCFYWGTLGDKKEVGNLRNVWRCRKESVNSEIHPTVKPIEIIAPCIKMCVSQGQLILDLFLGSGSTMVASHQLKRKCYGMELDPKYCQVIIDRMRKLDPNLVIKRNGINIE